MTNSWGSPKVVSRGVVHQADTLPGFVGEMDGEKMGFLTYHIHENMLEIVALNVLKQRKGIGRALIERVCELAASTDCRRVWVITTNDNKPAIDFYKAIGFEIVKIHEGAIKESRRLKPEIPLVGIDEIPITDEIELEYKLENTYL